MVTLANSEYALLRGAHLERRAATLDTERTLLFQRMISRRLTPPDKLKKCTHGKAKIVFKEEEIGGLAGRTGQRFG